MSRNRPESFQKSAKEMNAAEILGLETVENFLQNCGLSFVNSSADGLCCYIPISEKQPQIKTEQLLRAINVTGHLKTSSVKDLGTVVMVRMLETWVTLMQQIAAAADGNKVFSQGSNTTMLLRQNSQNFMQALEKERELQAPRKQNRTNGK